MEFPARLRKVGDSLVVTVPNEIVAKLELKEGDIRQFNLKEEEQQKI